MSIDLTWPPLPDTLPSSLIKHLNEQLRNSQRPSFIGPIEVTSLDFGDVPPDVEIIDMRDIYRDFLEDDDDVSDSAQVPGDVDAQKRTQQGGNESDEDDEFEWVSRRAAVQHEREEQQRLQEQSVGGFAYEHLPPHVRMGYGSSPSMDLWNHSTPGLAMDFARPVFHHTTPSSRPTPSPRSSSPAPPPNPPPQPEANRPSLPPNANPHPNLQLHFSIHWPSNLRLSLTTSLLINYPSPGFMSLPIKLSVTGLLFDGEVVVAASGTGKNPGTPRRAHICIMDSEDPYAPAASRKLASSVASEEDDPSDPHGDYYSSEPSRSGGESNAGKTVGQRILPNIMIESEIGQADKHVLKNVTRVERFIQDAIRKTVEEELVWPNFWTGVLGES
ncbi:hypothetical protein DL96DRAFT_1591030 [Flagelloscypha sp. PMI_526]|nr:hypothetical protein DL96DRAFT_1591030 [Flagelloscypha sp. PMI_526]